MKHELIESIGAVWREVREGERDGSPTRIVIAERAYDAAVDDVWDALTSRERIPRWFLPIDGDLRLGGRYQLEGNARGEVTACDPPTNLALTWEFGDQLSWVAVVLSEGTAGGTLLRLEHTVPVDDHWEEYGPGAVGVGWDLTLAGFGVHLLTGQTVQMDEELLTGAEGLEAMTRSNEAWCAANIASGTSAEVARRLAERTLAAYTGQSVDDAATAETSSQDTTHASG